MPIYAYFCPECGPIDSTQRDDRIICPTCLNPAKREWRLKIDAASARHKGRWDPVVGAYVESERQFRSLLRDGQDRESASLGRDVKLATVDARDNEALSELHGWSQDKREADLEGTRKAERARKAQ